MAVVAEVGGGQVTQNFLDDPPPRDLSHDELINELRTFEAHIEALDHQIDGAKEHLKTLKSDREKAFLDMRRTVRESRQGRLFANLATGEIEGT